jgi:serine/threonine-protein kinase
MNGALVKDRYLIQKQLGQGGFAVTYLAIDRHLDLRPVVVKVLLDHRSEDPWVLKKFRQETQALARLDHPGIVAALDSGELPDGKPFLVMQYIKGVTLRHEIGPRGMNLERTAHIVRQLAQALSAAQNSGICHRDVKPENIMLQSLGDSEEQAKLLDFGIATVRDSMTSTSGASTTISGSWGYMAARADRRQIYAGQRRLFAGSSGLRNGDGPATFHRRHAGTADCTSTQGHMH